MRCCFIPVYTSVRLDTLTEQVAQSWYSGSSTMMKSLDSLLGVLEGRTRHLLFRAYLTTTFGAGLN